MSKTINNKRYRLYCVTDYILCKDWWDTYIKSENPRYVYAGLEICPTSGKPHWQMYIYFGEAKAFSSKFAERLSPRHIEACFGTLKEQELYCNKDGTTAFEYGTKPSQGKSSNVQTLCEMIKEGKSDLDLIEENPQAAAQYGRMLDKYRQLIEPKRNWVTNVIVLWGGSGSGKTRKAIEAGATKVKYTRTSGFIIGYNGEDTILFDDFNWHEMPASEFLNLTDRYEEKINIKGGERNWKPRTIYFTSNYDPKDWYSNYISPDAIQRRITSVEKM